MKDWLELNRRDFLTALGTVYGTTACAMAAPRSWFLDYAQGEDGSPTERFVNTLCSMCPGGCGLKVRMVHGCAVGVRGNKDHPINRGGLCSRASAILQDLYNPDRLHKPLKRVGDRGSDRWEEIEWDTAINMVANKLKTIRDHGQPHTLCTIIGRDRGLTRSSWKRFMQGYGSPNLIDAHPDDNLGVHAAVLATQGVWQRIGYDIAKSNYILSFSSGWLDAHWSTEQAARAFGDFRRSRPGFRPKWVHAEPRFSITATKADEWLANKPGTDGTLALGIAHVMIREGLYDRDFVEKHGFGFHDWTDNDGKLRLGFRRMVLQDYAPNKVQAITGIPEGDIFRIAREFSSNQPAIALGFDGGGCSSQATYDRMAIHCLNALNGSIDVPGGVTLFRETALLDDHFEIDPVADKGLLQDPLDGLNIQRRLSDSSIDLLIDSLEKQDPYKAQAMILVDADPVFSLAEGSRFGQALQKVPFIAAFSSYHNNSAVYADVIIPTMHSLHRWDYNEGHTLEGHPVVTVSQPVMEPSKNMRDGYNVLHTIANKIGSSVASTLPWPDAQTAVDAVCKELFDRGKGAAFGPANEVSWAQLLESRGWRAPFATNYRSFKKNIIEGGGWTDPIYFHREWDRVFQSPSRKFAFRSAFLTRSFEAMPEQADQEMADRRCLPDCQIRPRPHNKEYPLDLYVYPLPNLVSVSSPNLPWLNDIAGAYMFEKWRTWVEIHPETAKHLHLHENDRVEISTKRGKFVLPVKLFSGLTADVIAIPYGLGHKSGGRWCKGIGENPAELVDTKIDPLTGKALWNMTQAKIRKV